MSRRSSPVFYPQRMQSEARHLEYARWNDAAVEAVRRIVEQKRAAGVVPAKATWIELRRQLRPEVIERLDSLVRSGRLIEGRSLNYRLYGLPPQDNEDRNDEQ